MILGGLIDEKTLKVISLFVKHKNEFFHINKVSKDAKVPLATAFRIIKKLEKNSFITSTKISKFKIYKLADNHKTKILGDLL